MKKQLILPFPKITVKNKNSFLFITHNDTKGEIMRDTKKSKTTGKSKSKTTQKSTPNTQKNCK